MCSTLDKSKVSDQSKMSSTMEKSKVHDKNKMTTDKSKLSDKTKMCSTTDKSEVSDQNKMSSTIEKSKVHDKNKMTTDKSKLSDQNKMCSTTDKSKVHEQNKMTMEKSKLSDQNKMCSTTDKSKVSDQDKISSTTEKSKVHDKKKMTTDKSKLSDQNKMCSTTDISKVSDQDKMSSTTDKSNVPGQNIRTIDKFKLSNNKMSKVTYLTKVESFTTLEDNNKTSHTADMSTVPDWKKQPELPRNDEFARDDKQHKSGLLNVKVTQENDDNVLAISTVKQPNKLSKPQSESFVGTIATPTINDSIPLKNEPLLIPLSLKQSSSSSNGADQVIHDPRSTGNRSQNKPKAINKRMGYEYGGEQSSTEKTTDFSPWKLYEIDFEHNSKNHKGFSDPLQNKLSKSESSKELTSVSKNISTKVVPPNAQLLNVASSIKKKSRTKAVFWPNKSYIPSNPHLLKVETMMNSSSNLSSLHSTIKSSSELSAITKGQSIDTELPAFSSSSGLELNEQPSKVLRDISRDLSLIKSPPNNNTVRRSQFKCYKCMTNTHSWRDCDKPLNTSVGSRPVSWKHIPGIHSPAKRIEREVSNNESLSASNIAVPLKKRRLSTDNEKRTRVTTFEEYKALKEKIELQKKQSLKLESSKANQHNQINHPEKNTSSIKKLRSTATTEQHDQIKNSGTNIQSKNGGTVLLNFGIKDSNILNKEVDKLLYDTGSFPHESSNKEEASIRPTKHASCTDKCNTTVIKAHDASKQSQFIVNDKKGLNTSLTCINKNVVNYTTKNVKQGSELVSNISTNRSGGSKKGLHESKDDSYSRNRQKSSSTEEKCKTDKQAEHDKNALNSSKHTGVSENISDSSKVSKHTEVSSSKEIHIEESLQNMTKSKKIKSKKHEDGANSVNTTKPEQVESVTFQGKINFVKNKDLCSSKASEDDTTISEKENGLINTCKRQCQQMYSGNNKQRKKQKISNKELTELPIDHTDNISMHEIVSALKNKIASRKSMTARLQGDKLQRGTNEKEKCTSEGEQYVNPIMRASTEKVSVHHDGTTDKLENTTIDRANLKENNTLGDIKSQHQNTINKQTKVKYNYPNTSLSVCNTSSSVLNCSSGSEWSTSTECSPVKNNETFSKSQLAEKSNELIEPDQRSSQTLDISSQASQSPANSLPSSKSSNLEALNPTKQMSQQPELVTLDLSVEGSEFLESPKILNNLIHSSVTSSIVDDDVAQPTYSVSYKSNDQSTIIHSSESIMEKTLASTKSLSQITGLITTTKETHTIKKAVKHVIVEEIVKKQKTRAVQSDILTTNEPAVEQNTQSKTTQSNCLSTQNIEVVKDINVSSKTSNHPEKVIATPDDTETSISMESLSQELQAIFPNQEMMINIINSGVFQTGLQPLLQYLLKNGNMMTKEQRTSQFCKLINQSFRKPIILPP